MKLKADLKRREFEFKVGDWVLVRLQPYRPKLVSLKIHKKLVLRYFRHFEIIMKISSVAYMTHFTSLSSNHSRAKTP